MQYTAALNNWKIIDQFGVYKISGQLCDQDEKGRFEPSDFIVTSAIQVLNLAEGWVKTKNSTYKLVG